MKKKLKNNIKIGAFFIGIMLFLSSLFAFGTLFVYHANADEGEVKRYCTATIEDDFSEDKIIVVMTKAATKKFKNYSIEDFSELSIKTIEDLSQPVKSLLMNSQEQLNKDDNNMVRENFRSILRLTLENASKQGVLRAIHELEQRADVLCVEPDYAIYIENEPDDADYANGLLWSLSDNNFGIHAPQAWDITTGSNNVRVGVYDTGIDFTHPDLRNRVNESLSQDLRNDSNSSGALTDIVGHGTHVAGIIGAQGNNGIGVTGVNWNVELVSFTHDDDFSGYISDLISVMQYSTVNNIPVINNSSGSDNYSGSSNALEIALNSYPGLFVTSAGNATKDNDKNDKRFPSNIKANNLLSVGALDPNGDRRYTSNYGINTVGIYAPGGNIWSTIPISINPSGYAIMSGTSMAAPHVSGVAALMLSANPNLTGAQLKSLLLNNSDEITISTPAGTQNVKKLNAYKAVLAAQNALFQTNDLSANTSEIAGLNRTTLEKLNIPASLNGKTVVSIGTNAFKNCVHLEKVLLPESLTDIKSGAFSGCNKLKTVLFGNRDSVATLGTNCFQNTANDLKLLVASDLYGDYRSSTGGQAYANKFVKTYLEGEKLYYEEITAVSAEGYVTCDAYFYLPDKDPILLDQNVGRIGFDRYYIMVSLCGVEYPLGAIDDCRLAIEVGSGEDCFILTKEGTIAGYCPYEDGYLYVPYMQLYQKGITEFYIFAMQKYAQLMTFYPSDVTIQLIHKIYL